MYAYLIWHVFLFSPSKSQINMYTSNNETFCYASHSVVCHTMARPYKTIMRRYVNSHNPQLNTIRKYSFIFGQVPFNYVTAKAINNNINLSLIWYTVATHLSFTHVLKAAVLMTNTYSLSRTHSNDDENKVLWSAQQKKRRILKEKCKNITRHLEIIQYFFYTQFRGCSIYIPSCFVYKQF